MAFLRVMCLLVWGFSWAHCQAQTPANIGAKSYGKVITPKNSVAAYRLPQVLGNRDSMAVKVTGQVVNVCQAKGCWLDVKLSDNRLMKVRFKDYGFFVPKNITGKTVVLNGMAYNQSLSVAEQRHYAQDAGQSQNEINRITQPKKSITFLADGVLVK